MTTSMEERLTAAFDATAQTVGPEDLRPLVITLARRQRAGALVACAVGAAAAAVLALWVHQGADADRHPTPGPATRGPATPVPESSGLGLDQPRD